MLSSQFTCFYLFEIFQVFKKQQLSPYAVQDSFNPQFPLMARLSLQKLVVWKSMEESTTPFLFILFLEYFILALQNCLE